MKILIDGDSCCVISSTEKIAKQYDIPCHIYCDTKHMLDSSYSEIHIVDSGKDSADFAIINKCDREDIVITNDSGLAAMVLAKNGFALNSNGTEYTKKNILSFLNKRYVRRDAQRKTNRDQVRGSLYGKKKKHYNYTAVLTEIIERPRGGLAESIDTVKQNA